MLRHRSVGQDTGWWHPDVVVPPSALELVCRLPFAQKHPTLTRVDLMLLLSLLRYVDMYAADDKLFFEDFAKAFSTLLELGTKDLVEATA